MLKIKVFDCDCENQLLKKENRKLKTQIEEYQKALDETMSEKIDIENNWSKLKEYLKSFDIKSLHEYMEHNLANTLESILNKMQEIEKGSDSNE